MNEQKTLEFPVNEKRMVAIIATVTYYQIVYDRHDDDNWYPAPTKTIKEVEYMVGVCDSEHDAKTLISTLHPKEQSPWKVDKVRYRIETVKHFSF